MSYDITIYEKYQSPSDGKIYGCEEFWVNITFNVRSMLQEAFQSEEGIYVLKNAEAKFATPLVAKAIANMTADPKSYKELEPANGWGSYQNTLGSLVELLSALIKNPTGWVEVV